MKLRRTHRAPVEDRLTEEQRADLAELVPVSAGSAEKASKFAMMRCTFCGGAHSRTCPRVSKIEFDASGRVIAATFFPWGAWPEDQVVWADDVWKAE